MIKGDESYQPYQAPVPNKWSSPPYRAVAEEFDQRVQNTVMCSSNQQKQVMALESKDYTVGAAAGVAAGPAAADVEPIGWMSGEPLEPNTTITEGTAVYLVVESMKRAGMPCVLALGEVTRNMVSGLRDARTAVQAREQATFAARHGFASLPC
jgi:hypothetical protein